jgi:hypothetical protein
MKIEAIIDSDAVRFGNFRDSVDKKAFNTFGAKKYPGSRGCAVIE